MTRAECIKILSDETHPQYQELSHVYRVNYNKCRRYYDELGFKGYVLHHKIINCDNYEEWCIEEIEPMTRSQHSRLHMVLYQQGLGNPDNQGEIIRKRQATRAAHGPYTAWNKGLTRSIDSRIPVSPRKGKTGQDFPFLCASKKGKSGGWNRGLSGHPSLQHTEEWKAAQSERMKLNNPMRDEAVRQKQLETVRNPEVVARRVEKLKGRKRYTNGVVRKMFKPGEEPEGFYPCSKKKEGHR